jgi:hypothetical protein
MDSSLGATPTPTPTSVATIPVAILTALSRAIVGWTTAVYPGTTASLEVASRDPAARRPHTWQATARLSNGMRLRFTLVVQDNGAACVTRHMRLATPRTREFATEAGTPPHGWTGHASQNRGPGRPRAASGPYHL